MYDLTLWVALIVLGIGVIHRIDAWFLRDVGLGDRSAAPSSRVGAGLKGVLGAVFSRRFAGVLKALILDVLLQWRILRDAGDPLAWVMHLAIFWGFILLLVFHALGSTFGGWIAEGYVSTLNPFLFLRNLAGLVLAAGLVAAVARRIRRRTHIVTSGGDKAAVGLLILIVVSGFLLEGLKITSNREFDRMVTDYTGGALTGEDTDALRAVWVDRFGLVSQTPVASHDTAVIAQGLTLHEGYCQSCHARPQAAFVSYPVSRVLSPVAPALDRAAFVDVFWWIHVLACFAGLAWLAFGKMFHVVSTPVSLVVAEVAGASQSPAAAATRQVIELDGCRHGGACHDTCPVRVRRLERIGGEATYEPMLGYLGRKSAADLGSRPVSD